jgi:hypothetical protein
MAGLSETGDLWIGDVLFPLTPALSLGERESPIPRGDDTRALGLPRHWRQSSLALMSEDD